MFQTVLFFPKLNELLSGYFDPSRTNFYNINTVRGGLPNVSAKNTHWFGVVACPCKTAGCSFEECVAWHLMFVAVVSLLSKHAFVA